MEKEKLERISHLSRLSRERKPDGTREKLRQKPNNQKTKQ